jgi:4-hydroxybenzoate polyprenyltransferase
MNSPNPKKKKPLDNYARYSSIAFQMLVIIGLGIWGGVQLDKWVPMRFPLFTVVMSLISVSFAIYYAIKDF